MLPPDLAPVPTRLVPACSQPHHRPTGRCHHHLWNHPQTPESHFLEHPTMKTKLPPQLLLLLPLGAFDPESYLPHPPWCVLRLPQPLLPPLLRYPPWQGLSMAHHPRVLPAAPSYQLVRAQTPIHAHACAACAASASTSASAHKPHVPLASVPIPRKEDQLQPMLLLVPPPSPPPHYVLQLNSWTHHLPLRCRALQVLGFAACADADAIASADAALHG